MTLSPLVLGHFVDDPDDMTMFRPIQTKIKGTSLLERPLAKNGHIPAQRPGKQKVSRVREDIKTKKPFNSGIV